MSAVEPPPAADAPPPAPGPAWEAITESVACPLCGYNLRGLIDPRCPECGYTFRWPALLNPSERLHPYLFEHHPERNAWSFFRTLAGSLLPRRFWRSLQPAQPSRPRRLVAYWLLASLLTLAAAFVQAGQSLNLAARENEQMRALTLFGVNRSLATPSPYRPVLQAEIASVGAVQAYVDKQFPPTFTRKFLSNWFRYYSFLPVLRTPLVFALWPWLTFATLMIFAASMRRAKVRPVHVLRCAIYCCDCGVWIVPLVLVAFYFSAASYALMGNMPLPHGGLVLAGVVLPFYTTYRLAAAYKLYLGFDHPVATAISAQVIVSLLLLVLAANDPF